MLPVLQPPEDLRRKVSTVKEKELFLFVVFFFIFCLFI